MLLEEGIYIYISLVSLISGLLGSLIPDSLVLNPQGRHYNLTLLPTTRHTATTQWDYNGTQEHRKRR